jgi:predicted peptidase
MGISMGGFGIWDWITRDPQLFAAVIPICGGVDTSVLHKVKELPIWMFHGALDTVVWPNRSRDAHQTLKNLGSITCKFTEFPNVAHNCWIRVCADSSVFDWLFNQQN